MLSKTSKRWSLQGFEFVVGIDFCDILQIVFSYSRLEQMFSEEYSKENTLENKKGDSYGKFEHLFVLYETFR